MKLKCIVIGLVGTFLVGSALCAEEPDLDYVTEQLQNLFSAESNPAKIALLVKATSAKPAVEKLMDSVLRDMSDTHFGQLILRNDRSPRSLLRRLIGEKQPKFCRYFKSVSQSINWAPEGVEACRKAVDIIIDSFRYVSPDIVSVVVKSNRGHDLATYILLSSIYGPGKHLILRFEV